MNKPPKWPFRCPKEGWYLKEVAAIFAEDLDVPVDDTAEPGTPILVYGTCREHGRVWLTDLKYYDLELWRK